MSNVLPHSSTTIFTPENQNYVKAKLDLAKFLPSKEDNEKIRKKKSDSDKPSVQNRKNHAVLNN